MRALVTGSAGFVGRHMIQPLRDRGYEVRGIDIHPGDCGIDVRRWFEDHPADRFDLVVHCAAVVGGRTMIDGSPLSLAAEDLSIDAALFRWALRARPGRIVYFSSSAAYPVKLQDERGARLQTRLAEDTIDPEWPFLPDQTYGWVKLTGERLAREANKAGIRTHVFRPFSGYGGDQALDYPFPAIIRRAVEHVRTPSLERGPFTVWGSPDSARDWVHIDDVVDCVLAAVDADDIGPMNICTGRAVTFGELADKVLDALGESASVIGDTTKPQGVFWRVGDPTRMRQTYTPRVTIEEGIERAVADITKGAAA